METNLMEKSENVVWVRQPISAFQRINNDNRDPPDRRKSILRLAPSGR
jgi:hypothetical protein